MSNKLIQEIEKTKIRELVAKGYDREEISKILGLNPRTYDRRVSDIKLGDLKAIGDVEDSTKAMIVVNTLEKIDKLRLQMQEIIDDPHTNNIDKIKAAEMVRQLLIDSPKLFLLSSDQLHIPSKYLDQTRSNGYMESQGEGSETTESSIES